jgi:hypothetical protein
MKTIVVSGARSNVGKTTLARGICSLLPGSVHVKLGHGERKEGTDNVFYHAGTPFGKIAEESPDAGFLVIESNRILEELKPDLAVYIPAEQMKPSAAMAEERADLTRGCAGKEEEIGLVGERLGVDRETAAGIVRLVCGNGGALDVEE